MASSTTEYFAVSALDGFGTTTVSNTVTSTTDASSTLLGAEAYEITWSPVPGSSGYAVFFGTSPTALNKYFYATTSGAYYVASTTSGRTHRLLHQERHYRVLCALESKRA